MITENGWPSCGPDQLDRKPIPGTNVVIALQQGQPATIMKAFAADLNWYVESVYNAGGSDSGGDEGGWTQTNSVPTSNHLGGTAMDYNWSDHPMGPQVPDDAAGWQWSEIVGGPEEPRVRELLEYYEGTIFWGNDWDQPHDSMHFQMGYQTFGNPSTQDFINRKIDLATGLSHFRDEKQSGNSGVDLALLLAEAMGETDGVDYASFIGSYRKFLIACDCTTVLRIAMADAQLGTESAGLKYMREIASGAEYEGRTDLGNTQSGDGVRFAGRGPIQVTGRHNYTVLSQWAFDNGYVSSPTYFVDNPEKLESVEYGFLGAEWYWTTQRPLNDAADAGDVVLATKYVNGGDHGLADRKMRYARNIAMGDRLLNLISGEEDWMSDPSIVQLIKDIHNALFEPISSQSRYKTDGEGSVWTREQLIQNDDGMVHESYVERLAVLGDSLNIALVVRQASRQDPLAESVLVRIDDKFLTTDQQHLKNLIVVDRFPSGGTTK